MDERRKKLRQSIHDWLEKGAYRDYVIEGIIDVDDGGFGLTDPPQPKFTESEINAEFGAMLEEGVVVQEPGCDFYVSVEMMPHTAAKYKAEAKWQHIEEGDHVHLSDGQGVVVCNIDYESETFSDDDYEWHPLAGVVPEPPAEKIIRLAQEAAEREAEAKWAEQQARERQKRYDELLTMAKSICKKLGHDMAKWTGDRNRCLKCFRSVYINMNGFETGGQTGVEGGCVTSECK
jgi:hypothetical protein